MLKGLWSRDGEEQEMFGKITYKEELHLDTKLAAAFNFFQIQLTLNVALLIFSAFQGNYRYLKI